MDEIDQALIIATKELRQCYYEKGIVAGTHHFTDYWARDGFFASFGSIALKDYDICKDMIELFFSYQREDGLIPYLIRNGPLTISKYFGKVKKYKKPKPNYKLRNIFQEIYDGTTLSIIIYCELALKNKISLEYVEKIKLALSYLEKKEKNNLLWDGIMAEWNDTAYKFGNLLYSNILYWYALKKFNELQIRNKKPANLTKQKQIENALRKGLWNEKYFADWYDYKRQNYFYPYANMLAVAWGLTNDNETNSILNYAKSAKIMFTLETNIPKYPFWRVDIGHHLVGMGNYQNKGILWFHPALTYVAALATNNNKDEARLQLRLIAKQIIKYHGVYECYERNGRPMKKLVNKSEHPFAWSSGLFIWATKLCNY